jgi:CBS domain-containing protein
MTPNPKVIALDASVMEAARLMKENGCSTIIVSNDNHPIGLISYSDIVNKVVAEDKSPQTILVKEIYNSNFTICHSEDSCERAGLIMEKELTKTIIVVDENKKIVGILSLTDIASKTSDEILTGEIFRILCEAKHKL